MPIFTPIIYPLFSHIIYPLYIHNYKYISQAIFPYYIPIYSRTLGYWFSWFFSSHFFRMYITINYTYTYICIYNRMYTYIYILYIYIYTCVDISPWLLSILPYDFPFYPQVRQVAMHLAPGPYCSGDQSLGPSHCFPATVYPAPPQPTCTRGNQWPWQHWWFQLL